MRAWVLVEQVAKRQGRILYFKQMTGIGPMCTAKRTEAARFSDKEAAARCPAMYHTLSSFVPEEIEVPDGWRPA